VEEKIMITLKPGQGVSGEGLEEFGCDDSGDVTYINTSGKQILTREVFGVSPLLIKRLLVNFSSNIKGDTRLFLHRQARIKDIREFSPEYWDRSIPDTLVGDFTFLVETPAFMNVRFWSERLHSYSLWTEPREFILSVKVQRITLADRESENHYFQFFNIEKAVVEFPHIFRGFESDAVDWTDVNNLGVNSTLKEYWESLKDLPSK